MTRKLRWLVPLLACGLLPPSARAQERGSMAGQVIVAETRQPLPGVHVSIPSLDLAVITDERGRFTLPAVPAGRHTLRVSLIGYRLVTREVSVRGGGETATVTIEMAADPLRLDELVVTGYGEQRRRNLAGAVGSLKPDMVREVPATSVNEVLQGRVAGVQVFQNSGVPGAAISVRVRGSASINAGNEPLYVIDGVPMNQGDFSRQSQQGFGGQDIDAISDINPSEIESIEILKDASAAAIYGSRASNGVVLITTKRGMAARPEISFGAYYGQQKDWRRIDLLNAEQYIEVYREGCMARYGADCVTFTDGPAAGSPVPSNVADAMRAVRGSDTDWLSTVLREAPISNIEGSIRGGTERVRYFVAGSGINQEGTIRTMGYQRLNGRVNLDYQPAEKLTLGTNVGLARSVYHRARADNTIYGSWSNAIANPPTEPVFTEDGGYFETLYANPVGMDNESSSEERGIRILGNAFASYELLQGLSARVSVGLDNLTLRSHSWDSPTFGPWQSNGGAAENAQAFVSKTTYEATANFNRTFADQHAFSGVVGSSYENNIDEGNSVRRVNFPTEFFRQVTSGATLDGGTGTRSDWTLMSFFGRLSYTFNDRITGTFNVRRDGSSRFGEANRYGTFPSVSVLWRVGEEGFMQGQSVFSNLALRASYGITGNQQTLGNFASRGLFTGGSNYNDEPGIRPLQLENPELKWEKTQQTNVGTDFAVLNNRLLFTLDAYWKTTEDLLVSLPVPSTTGFSSIWSNVGEMENKGIDASLEARILEGRNGGFGWTSTLNLSHNKNKVLELYNDQPIGGTNRVEEGKPLGFFYGYTADGIFQSMEEVTAHARQVLTSNPRTSTAPGDIRFRDLNGDNVINSSDRSEIGSPWPDYEGGWTNTLSFRGLDLTAFVQFSQGNEIYNNNRIFMDRYGSGGDNHTTRALRRWTPENPNTDEPRAVWGDPNQNARVSTRFIEDGSYVRLKNMVLGYALPSSLVSRGGFRTARIYVQGQNLWTKTDYTGFDPEVNTSGQTSITRGVDFYTLPQTRTITFGMNVSF